MADQDNRSVEDLLVVEQVKDMIEFVAKDIPNIKRIAIIYDVTEDADTEVTICRSVGFINDYEKYGFLLNNLNTIVNGRYEDTEGD